MNIRTENTGFSRRAFLEVAGMAAMGGLASYASGAAEKGANGKKPNIVLIMADDLGYEWLGCYGNAAKKTPILDKIAEKGIRFTNCYSQPICTPSRVQIMTGRYNHRNYEGFGYLNPKEITFGNILRDAGYKTCISGKWQLSGDADTVRKFGFDEHCLWNMRPAFKRPSIGGRSGPRYKAPHLLINGKWHDGAEDEYGPQIAADFVCSFIERNKDNTFLCYYPMILPHGPFVPTPDSKPESNTSAEKKSMVDYFPGMVAYLDKLVGQIVEKTEELGIADNTLILFTTDNGTATTVTAVMKDKTRIRGEKGRLSENGTHVPLIAYWKGTTPQGIVSDDLIDFTDFFVTLAEVAGVKMPDDRKIDGVSFLPQLRGEKGTPREWIFFHYWLNGRNKDKTKDLVQDKNWRYSNGRLTPAKKTDRKPDSQEMESIKEKFQAVIDKLKKE